MPLLEFWADPGQLVVTRAR